ncbi:MAG: hypothetical protein FWD59_06715 [Micrococcales bacterium]|nr:hypothetical protein [Micrococcales bacterium]
MPIWLDTLSGRQKLADVTPPGSGGGGTPIELAHGTVEFEDYYGGFWEQRWVPFETPFTGVPTVTVTPSMNGPNVGWNQVYCGHDREAIDETGFTMWMLWEGWGSPPTPPLFDWIAVHTPT